MIGFALALATSAPDGGPFASLPHRPATHAEAENAVIGCALPAKSVSVQFEQDMQEDVVWISSASGHLTAQKLNCVARASLRMIYYVHFRDQAVQKRYDKAYFTLSYVEEVADARAWLRAHNRLSALPLPKKGEPLSNYTQAVEAFCGIKKGSLLVATDRHFITYAKDGLGQITSDGIEHAVANEAQFECVMNATSAADLEAYGLGIGFIGNAAASSR